MLFLQEDNNPQESEKFKWMGKFSEILLHGKVRFHSNLNMKDNGGDYAHTKRVCKQKSLKRIHYCKLMYLTTFRIGALKYMNLPLLLFLLQ